MIMIDESCFDFNIYNKAKQIMSFLQYSNGL